MVSRGRIGKQYLRINHNNYIITIYGTQFKRKDFKHLEQSDN